MPATTEQRLTPDTYRLLTNVPFEWTDERSLCQRLSTALNKQPRATAVRFAQLCRRRLVERRWTAQATEIRRLSTEAHS